MTTPDGSWLSYMLKSYDGDGPEKGGAVMPELRDGILYVTFLPHDDTPHTTERYRVTRID